MFTVALIGADGAGKSTVVRRLRESAPVPLRSIYMGLNPEAATHALPTTRFLHLLRRWSGRSMHQGGPPDPGRQRPDPRSLAKRVLRSSKRAVMLVHRLSEESYRLLVAAWYRRRGFVVLFDRDFFADYHAHDMSLDAASRPLSRRIHGWVLRHLYPLPDRYLFLDAPAEVLFARKGEGSIALLEARRAEYVELARQVKGVTIVDASQELDLVIADVERWLRRWYEERRSPAEEQG